MNNNPPPLIFGLLGVVVGVGVAWLMTGDGPMALVFLVVGVIVLVTLRLVDRRRRMR